MERHVTLLGYPVHPMLIVPLGLLATAVDDADLNASNSISREGIAKIRA